MNIRLELHITSPPRGTATNYVLTGQVQGPGAADVLGGGSVRVQSLVSGLVEEAFFDAQGAFEQNVELAPEQDNPLQLTVCDPAGREVARVPFCVRHQAQARQAGLEAPPVPAEIETQTLTPPWQRFAQLVKECLHQAADAADQTGRDRTELFEQVYAQERYAERAYEERNQALYQECFDNLTRLAGYLERLRCDALSGYHRGPAPSPQERARRGDDAGLRGP